MITDQTSLETALDALNTQLLAAVQQFNAQIPEDANGRIGNIGVGYQYIGNMELLTVSSGATIELNDGTFISAQRGEN